MGKALPAVEQRAAARLYRQPSAFTDLLPWVEYDPEHRLFLLEDGISAGALFELEPVGTEARTPAFMASLRDALQTALTDAIPEEAQDPWVLQLYVQDEASLAPFAEALAEYGDARLRQAAFARHQQLVMQAHLARISAPGGLFVDQAVSGSPWRGKRRVVRATLFRRLSTQRKPPSALEIAAGLNDVAARWTAALASSGVQIRRSDAGALYEWLLPWFNPDTLPADGNRELLRRLARYPDEADRPFGYDFAEQLTLSPPRSADGLWWFDARPHTIVSVQGLRHAPSIGHITAERRAGDHLYALFDRLPAGTVMAMTLVFRPQYQVRNHVARVRHAAVGDSAEAILTRENAVAVERRMAEGDKLYPLELAFYVAGDEIESLYANVNRVNALLLANGLQPVLREADLLSLDSYLRNLPMAYDPALDQRRRRSRLVFSRHTANLLPLYGRSRGTGHPGLVFFNRGAEPLVFDPLHAADRKKNAHMLILGPTGAGKSALLVYMLQQMLAIYRPRVFIIEVGGSFALFGEHLRFHGVSVNAVTLTPEADVSLPPFADAARLSAGGRGAMLSEDRLAVDLDQDEVAEITGRDILGEMEIAARIMITGGDEREDARMTRADRLLIRKAIYRAAHEVTERGGSQVMTEDVVDALHAIGADPALSEHRRYRAIEMGDGMALFCSGLAGRFFNRPGTRWPDTDVTILDLGVLAREGYEDQLTVAYLSIMSHVNALIEQHQHQARPTLVVTDEGHIITTNPLLSRYVVKITKMWRKLGAWFWIATQTLEDFPDVSRSMLNMMEWWLCLVMPKEEVDQIARFKELSTEQKSLLLSTRKEPGKYAEGVVLADGFEALFRNVPPPLSLALAMTEKHEKVERAAIMRDQDCTALEAAYVIAERIARTRET